MRVKAESIAVNFIADIYSSLLSDNSELANPTCYYNKMPIIITNLSAMQAY